MGKHKNNYKSKNGRYYVLKGSNAVMIAYNWDQANECFRKYICSASPAGRRQAARRALADSSTHSGVPGWTGN